MSRFIPSCFLTVAGLLGSGFLMTGFLPAEGKSPERVMHGSYLETRSCQVYTGPCFANSEIGLTGYDAIMAWNVQDGAHLGVDLDGLSIVMVVRGDETLAHAGLDDPHQIRSILIVDERARPDQKAALIDFVKQRTGKAGNAVQAITMAPIEMTLHQSELIGSLTAGQVVKLTTRRARKGDCICANEVAYYPPLTELSQFVPGVSIEAEFKGRGLGTQWSNPNSRSAYMGLFSE